MILLVPLPLPLWERVIVMLPEFDNVKPDAGIGLITRLAAAVCFRVPLVPVIVNG